MATSEDNKMALDTSGGDSAVPIDEFVGAPPSVVPATPLGRVPR